MTVAPRALPVRTALLVALGGLTLLTGCSAASDGAQPAAAPPPSPAAPPAAVVSATAVAPPSPTTVRGGACPDAAALFARLPTAETAGARAVPGSTTCAGDWAVIGLRQQSGQSVALFSSATGSWQPVDTAQACADGTLPAALADGVCNAG